MLLQVTIVVGAFHLTLVPCNTNVACGEDRENVFIPWVQLYEYRMCMPYHIGYLHHVIKKIQVFELVQCTLYLL